MDSYQKSFVFNTAYQGGSNQIFFFLKILELGQAGLDLGDIFLLCELSLILFLLFYMSHGVEAYMDLHGLETKIALEEYLPCSKF